MFSRRNFLVNSSLASVGLLIAKPIKTFASASTALNKITILHTAHFAPSNIQNLKTAIKQLKNKQRNLLLLNATNNLLPLKFDAAVNNNNDIKEYKIIYKGGIKIGLVSSAIDKGADENIKINAISSYLKNKKKCNLVICISNLGYKQPNGVDDISLAQQSTDIDIIISGHPHNFSKHPQIALNSKKQEVIINHAEGYSFNLGKIAIAFDSNGKKNTVDFLLN